MSLTNWFPCTQVRHTFYGTECQLMVGSLMANFGYQLPTGTCRFPFPEWCYSNETDAAGNPIMFCSDPDKFAWLHNTWEICAETQGTQCRFEKTILDAKYGSGTYCPYGNDSKGQVEPTYIMAIFLLLWAVYAMMFFGNSRR